MLRAALGMSISKRAALVLVFPANSLGCIGDAQSAAVPDLARERRLAAEAYSAIPDGETG